MNRTLLAALALACVCSPAMAAGLLPAPPGVEPMAAAQSFAFLGVLGACIFMITEGFIPRRAVSIGLLVVFAIFSVPAAALAQVATTVAQPANDTAIVTVPYGSWIGSLAASFQEIVVSLVMVVITFALRNVPAAIGNILKGILTQQVVEKGVAFGFNTVAGATKGATLSFDVGNAVLANALNYVVTHVPAWLLTWVGGTNAIRDHIIALLPMDANASLATSTPTAAGPTTTAPVPAAV